MNVYANFDLLYLMANITAKYSELSFYEIETKKPGNSGFFGPNAGIV